MTKKVSKIASDLEHLAFPIDKLKLLPGNYNKGDVLGVAESYKEFGQRKAIVARHDNDSEIGVVIAGNTQLQAARDILGWTEIAVSWADDLSDEQAIGYAVGDNNLGRKGEVDVDALLDFVAQIPEDMLPATGYSQEDIDTLIEVGQTQQDAISDILTNFEKSEDDEYDDEDDEEDDDSDTSLRPAPRPVIQYQLVFDDEEQQQNWFKFVRWLKREFDDAETVAERINLFLEKNLPDGVL